MHEQGGGTVLRGQNPHGGHSGTILHGRAPFFGTEDEEGGAPGVGKCGGWGQYGCLQDAAPGGESGAWVDEVAGAFVVAGGGARLAVGEGEGAERRGVFGGQGIAESDGPDSTTDEGAAGIEQEVVCGGGSCGGCGKVGPQTFCNAAEVEAHSGERETAGSGAALDEVPVEKGGSERNGVGGWRGGGRASGMAVEFQQGSNERVEGSGCGFGDLDGEVKSGFEMVADGYPFAVSGGGSGEGYRRIGAEGGGFGFDGFEGSPGGGGHGVGGGIGGGTSDVKSDSGAHGSPFAGCKRGG